MEDDAPPDAGQDDSEGPRPDLPPAVPGRGRRRRVIRLVAAVTAGLLAVGGVAAAVVYRQLNANIRSAPLTTGVGEARPTTASTDDDDPYAGRAFNVLVIGSDSRDDKDNCTLGGACDGGTHADVEMVVHVAGDRSNATVMSVPRDTMTDLPACENPADGASAGARYGQINATLEYGPGCTVAAVEKLTGIPIDHFVMIDFAGVIRMSDAVGGADVCVDQDVFDNRSHLKLSKGEHTITGEAALQFVRTRHAFGDGSDLGRTSSQHLYVSAVIRKLKSTGVLLNPVSVYQVAQEATRALTVDTGLASVGGLVKLARVLGAVPEERITFVTMQNVPDPNDSNRVVPAPAATELFRAIADDRPLTADAPAATPSTTPSATPSPSGSPSATTTPGKKAREAVAGANPTTAGDSGECAKVSTGYVVAYQGRMTTPQLAYAASTDVPDSAG